MPIGPCIGCGATNYANSFGGLGLCPTCDSGATPTNASRSITEPFRPIFYPDYSELLQQIREAAGDPRGKLMQDELVEHITKLRSDAVSLRRVYGQGIAAHGVTSGAEPYWRCLTCAGTAPNPLTDESRCKCPSEDDQQWVRVDGSSVPDGVAPASSVASGTRNGETK